MKIRVHHVASGSSLLFTGLRFNSYTLYELIKKDKTVIVTYHGFPMVRRPYIERVSFFLHNGSISWKDVRKEDSGIYQHWMNLTIVEEILLQVIDPVTEVTLLQRNLQGDDSQCRIYLSCRARGEGPLQMKILKNQVEVAPNIATLYNATTLHLDGWDPAIDGVYSCRVTNRVSSKISAETKVQHIGSSSQMTKIYWKFSILLFWLILLILNITLFIYKLTHSQKEERKRHQATNEDAAVPLIASVTIRVADILNSSLKELAGIYASFAYGDIYPILFSLSVCSVTLRVLWYLYIYHGFWRFSYKRSTSFLIAMTLSSVFSLSLLLAIVHNIDNEFHNSSCNVFNKWVNILYAMIIMILLIEIILLVMYMRKVCVERKQLKTRECSDLAGENKNPALKKPISDPNGNKEAKDQESVGVGVTEGSPEEEQDKSHSRTDQIQNQGNLMDPESGEGQRFPTERNEVALDHDQVANG